MRIRIILSIMPDVALMVFDPVIETVTYLRAVASREVLSERQLRKQEHVNLSSSV